MCQRIGIGSLAGLNVLDFGCGSRVAEAIINRNVPLKSYAGIVVDKLRPALATASLGVALANRYPPAGSVFQTRAGNERR
jgi:hypothetical protein